MTLEDNCTTNVWEIIINKKGTKISDTVREEINQDKDHRKTWHN